MHMADVAWNEVDTTTICNCWCKTGILPESLFNPTSTAASTVPLVPVSSLLNHDPVDLAIAAAEKQVADSLSQLEQLRVFQPTNQMALQELLNPVNKNVMHDNAVMECVEREEVSSDVQDLTDTTKPKPAHHEALKAASTLQAYVADMNEPFAREMEVILAKFGHQTRLDKFKSYQPTAITDYLATLDTNA
ncbi:hypothetical protein C0993_010513 [Termitomyces sp. T159_Od127]|nr:hypothetical protein C0993_010513 [Termitomyces sp. T159_Od127]